MLPYGTASTRCSMICPGRGQAQLPIKKPLYPAVSTRATACQKIAAALASTIAAALVLSANAIEVATPQDPEETLSNIPQTLSSVCSPEQQDCKKMYKIQRPKSKKAERCTSKCATTCTQGGFGSPGDGPFSNRRPVVVFKDGFRSRKYCLSECSDICNLIGDGDEWP